MSGSILGLFASPEGGVPKPRVPSLVVTNDGCVGDRQNDLKHHGGPRRAVCLMTNDVMQMLQDEGHPIQGGTTGENLLIDGIPWTSLNVGCVLRTKDVTIRITGDAPPCKTIKASFTNHAFKELAHKQSPQKTRWYAEVLKEGTLHSGEPVHLEQVS